MKLKILSLIAILSIVFGFAVFPARPALANVGCGGTISHTPTYSGTHFNSNRGVYETSQSLFISYANNTGVKCHLSMGFSVGGTQWTFEPAICVPPGCTGNPHMGWRLLSIPVSACIFVSGTTTLITCEFDVWSGQQFTLQQFWQSPTNPTGNDTQTWNVQERDVTGGTYATILSGSGNVQ